MKFTIAGVRQKVMVYYKFKVVDATILSYLRILFNSKSKKLIRIFDAKGDMYTYVKSDLAVKNLPILHMSPHTFQTDYLKKYTDKKILLRIERRKYYHTDGKLFYHPQYYYRFSTTEYFQLFSGVQGGKSDTYSRVKGIES